MPTVEIFTTPDCPRCPNAIALLESLKDDYVFDLRITDAVENRQRALQHGVLSVPTVIINGDTTITGVPTREDVVAHLTDQE